MEIEALLMKAKQYITEHTHSQELDFTDYRTQTKEVLDNIQSMKLIGIRLVLGGIFDEIGFSIIQDELFKDLVLYRLVYPASKLKTTEYLFRYEGKSFSEDDIYRYMDKLYNTQKELVQDLAYTHTQSILSSKIELVFYDVTTLYFEIDRGDDLRKTGFSKEGRHQNPQILLGLLVAEDGYPLAYDIFPGNKYEGHTMLPVLNGFKTKYQIENIRVVADSGLLTSTNIEQLQSNNYEFILGARIKNETEEIKNKILALNLKDGESSIIQKGDLRLIVTYSDKRSGKDKYNREKGLERLEKKIKSGKLTKANINNKGYNKYLRLEGEVAITIDRDKYIADEKWDGLKGYLTNATLPTEKILENYQHLWKIEKAFRVTKTDLKIRPIFHRLPRRIEAHICLNFVAYKVYKELERYLKNKKVVLSPEKVIEILQNIYQIEVCLPNTNELYTRVLLLTDEQKNIAKIFGF
ncbi:MAG: IS1634 family transposase [Chitinophagales bacterium]|nr:IS1634 family transposase [Chitinophagales bacterium]